MHANNICKSFGLKLCTKHVGFVLRPSKWNLSTSSFHHQGLNKNASFAEKTDNDVATPSTKNKLDIEVMKNYTLRQTLKTLYTERRKPEKNFVEKSEASGYHSNCQVQIYHSGKNLQSFLVVSIGQKYYCINPFPAFPRFMANNDARMPFIENILFTRLDWKSTFALLPHLINSNHSNDSNILSFFGPPGTTNNCSHAIPLLLSVKGRQEQLSRIVYHEYYNNKINTVRDGNLEISMVNTFPKSVSSNKSVQTSNPSKVPITGYIFKNKNVHEKFEHISKKTLHSWKDFDGVERYMQYIKKLKSNQVENFKNCSEHISTIAFVDFPDFDYFDNMLVDNPFYHYHKTNSKISCIFHLTPYDVSSSSKYELWMSSFGSSCQHIQVSNKQTFEMGCFKSEVYRGVFHTVYPHFFPLYGNKHCLAILQDVMLSAISNSLKVPWKLYQQCYRSTTVKESLSELHLYEKNVSFVIQNHLHSLVGVYNRPVEFSKELAEVSYPRLVVLGSGGPNISVHRASPSYLIHLSKDISILLDCGVDTANQLYQHYGEQLLPQVLSTIKIVTISHKHSDHWMGLVNLLQEMHSKITVPYNTLVFLPTKIQKFLEEHCLKHTDPLLARLHFFPNEHAFNEISFLNQVARKVNLKQFRLIPVDHGPQTYGVMMKCWNGKKIVYSSDTLPMCENLIKEGQNADLLIHDCLYTDDNSELVASFKMHSTMRGAVATAHRMRAKNLMLTHFTGECRSLPIETLQTDEPFDGKILYALDHMEISVDHLKYFPHLHNTLQKAINRKPRIKRVSNRVKMASDLVELYDNVSKALNPA